MKIEDIMSGYQLTKEEAVAVKTLCDNYDIEGIGIYLAFGFITINKARNGKMYAWYMDEHYNAICDIETLEIITDETFIDEQLA